MNGKLYIVPTPIGNLKDTTLRAIEVLKNVSFIGAEDTRHAQKFLQKYDIKTPLYSYHKYNEKERITFFLNKLRNGEEGAIISDAGTPGISDPASIIIQACIKDEIIVETLPGATAFVPALVNSGLSTERFYFVGFLPSKKGQKTEILNQIKTVKDTLIFYEAPHRLESFLQIVYSILGKRFISIAKEISKIHETYYRDSIQNLIENFSNINLKGEFVIVIEGYKAEKLTESEIKNTIIKLTKNGLSKKEIILTLKEQYNIAKNEVYQLIIDIEND
jgi:16S rRNA (cytidine1402-2'-O)-methyltransferase